MAPRAGTLFNCKHLNKTRGNIADGDKTCSASERISELSKIGKLIEFIGFITISVKYDSRYPYPGISNGSNLETDATIRLTIRLTIGLTLGLRRLISSQHRSQYRSFSIVSYSY